MRSSRILIDVSEFDQWSGHLTGVQRVVFNIGNELTKNDLSSGRDVVCFTYNEASDTLVEVAGGIGQFEPSTTNKKNTADTASRVGRAKLFAKSLHKRLPYSIRSRLTNEHKAALKNTARRAIVISAKLRHKAKGLFIKTAHGTHQPKPLVVQPGDTILSAGRIWDHPKQQLAYSRLKRDHGIKIAYVIYDLIPIFQQHTFGPGLTEKYTEYLYEALSSADVLLPISHSSDRDLKRFAVEMGFDSIPETAVIRLGDDIPSIDITQNKPASLPPVITSKEFIICVGTIEARKNHQLLYNAYKLAAQQGVSLPQLVIVGRPGWLTADVTYFLENDLEVKEKIVLLKNCDDDALGWLYKNALMSVYPSQYEGWGLPVAEALAYGVPCISANVSSMPEIASDALVSFVSPFDSAQLLEAIIQLSNPEKNKRQAALIRKSYRPYYWEKTASTVARLI